MRAGQKGQLEQQGLGFSALAKKQNFPLAPNAQENTYVGEPPEERVLWPFSTPMCGKEEETMNHLFNTCDAAEILWKWAETIQQKTDKVRNSI